MKFIEALKLKSKLFFLFVFITIGLIFVGIVGASYISAMKRNVDSLYFGSLVPVTELHEIVQTYHGGISAPLHKVSRAEISRSQTMRELEKSLEHIEQKWKSYSQHYKHTEELDYIEYVDMELRSANRAFKTTLEYLKKGGKPENIALNRVEEKVSNLHSIIKKLINYEIEVAQFERKKFLNKYEDIAFNIGLTLVIVILAVLLITMYVFRSIQEDHTKLHAIAKKLKQVNKKLENASFTDSLTNLYNRRYFNHIYERELKRAKRHKNYITFMMLDIDFFKQYNDTYGHVEGDYALKSVAKVLKDTLRRPSDYVFRLGGEEFGVLFSETNESDSANLARKLCQVVKQREIKHEQSDADEFVTISIGVVCCIADEALDDEVLISRADEMLYKAKENGRDGYQITTDVSLMKVVSA
ncbi:diguanylate cyclase [Sulfurimonas marina]|uniref:diguanylate cyclase n=1 Tax=Sulfurimonas marina TaxID=2590551 RepID=A0A7M1AWA2_9BACT|nr:diguanylate cyclase [Sulfurimonas marina]QOP41737.1 diguanylate cyclase [Sulfurimonas marina]